MTPSQSVATQDSKDDCVTLTITQWAKTVSLTGTIDPGFESTQVGETWGVPAKNGNLCFVGKYCIGGVAYNCGLGKYCDLGGMSADGANCDAGYYCIGGAKNRRPTSLTDYFGDRCESGKWCAAGVSTGTLCPKGKFSSARGLTLEGECTTCP